MKFIIDILKGCVMGIANVIPGVSGGTMAVSMGIYDRLITALTHLFKEFKKSFVAVLPIGIGMVIGIERLHSHMGRHTFATWMLSQGAKIENVSRMLGHTDIKMTQRYAEVLAKDVYDDFEKVEKKLKNHH